MTSKGKAKSQSQGRNKGTRDQAQQNQPMAAERAEKPSTIEWHEYAVFQVAFDHATDAEGHIVWQTRAYHEEADDRAVWPGVTVDTLIRWLCDKVDLPTDMPTIEPRSDLHTAVPTAEPSAELRLDVGDMWIEEIPIERQVGEQTPAHCMSAQIAFQFSGAAADPVTSNQSRYVVQVLAYNLATDETTVLVANQQLLHPQLLAYTTAVEFALPPVGHYQMMGMVLLPDDNAVGTSLGPALTVIP